MELNSSFEGKLRGVREDLNRISRINRLDSRLVIVYLEDKILPEKYVRISLPSGSMLVIISLDFTVSIDGLVNACIIESKIGF